VQFFCPAVYICIVFYCADRKVLCLGIIQSLFEGSMYTFVLEWTPALTPSELHYHHVEAVDPVGHHALSTQTVNVDDIDEDGHRGAIPHGYIFAAFMVEFLVVFKLGLEMVHGWDVGRSQPLHFM